MVVRQEEREDFKGNTEIPIIGFHDSEKVGKIPNDIFFWY